MLEIRKYTKDELSAILGSNAKQNIDRKLQRYGVEFVSSGSGQNLTYEITDIPDRFKLYCITEMNIPASVNFEKFKYFCYYMLCDDSFSAFPVVEMQRIMSADGVQVSRQTISNWLRYLSRIGYIHRDRNAECIYYSISKTPDGKKHYTEIPKETYSKGWQTYWTIKNKNEKDAGLAYIKMYNYVGGHPYKHPKIDQNAVYTKEIEILIEIMNDSFLNR